MKAESSPLTRSYLAALRRHLKEGAVPRPNAAHHLGARAVKMGLDVLDLVKLHEEVFARLMLPHRSSHGSERVIREAGAFFSQALTPFAQSHHGARNANLQLKAIVEALTRRTVSLAQSNLELKKEIKERKNAEASLHTSEETSSQLLVKSRHMQEELRRLSRRLLSAQEEERRRISRELHDVIAQTLAGINVRLAGLKAEAAASSMALRRKISVAQRLVERSVSIVHRFACELRPTVLDDLGLIPALQSLIKSFIEQTGVRVSLDVAAAIEGIDSDRRTTLYRVVQEALTNVARHSKATTAKVSLRLCDGVIRLEIADHGQGFSVEATSHLKASSHLGLLGMRERVEMVGGTFCVESEPGHPTVIRAEIPENRAASKKRRPAKSSTTASLECP